MYACTIRRLCVLIPWTCQSNKRRHGSPGPRYAALFGLPRDLSNPSHAAPWCTARTCTYSACQICLHCHANTVKSLIFGNDSVDIAPSGRPNLSISLAWAHAGSVTPTRGLRHRTYLMFEPVRSALQRHWGSNLRIILCRGHSVGVTYTHFRTHVTV